MLLGIARFYCIERWSNLFTYIVDESAFLFVVVIGDGQAVFQLLDLKLTLEHDADEEQQTSSQCSCKNTQKDNGALLGVYLAFLLAKDVL